MVSLGSCCESLQSSCSPPSFLPTWQFGSEFQDHRLPRQYLLRGRGSFLAEFLEAGEVCCLSKPSISPRWPVHSSSRILTKENSGGGSGRHRLKPYLIPFHIRLKKMSISLKEWSSIFMVGDGHFSVKLPPPLGEKQNKWEVTFLPDLSAWSLPLWTIDS